MTATINT